MEFFVNPYVASLEARRGRLEQIRENSSRHAQCFAKYATHGQGQLLVATVVTFDVTFIEEPRVSTGWSMDGDTLIDGFFPMVSAGVWKWQQDRRDFYLGAWLVFNVTGDDSYDIDHHFTFSGIALKDLPAHLMEN